MDASCSCGDKIKMSDCTSHMQSSVMPKPWLKSQYCLLHHHVHFDNMTMILRKAYFHYVAVTQTERSWWQNREQCSPPCWARKRMFFTSCRATSFLYSCSSWMRRKETLSPSPACSAAERDVFTSETSWATPSICCCTFWIWIGLDILQKERSQGEHIGRMGYVGYQRRLAT